MSASTISSTISAAAARRYYDLVGARYDWASSFDSRAKARAIELLELQPGQWVLDVGVGTGKEHELLRAAVAPTGLAFGVDISPVMLALAGRRTGTPLINADVRQLPFAGGSFDLVVAAYVLDLIALPDLPRVLSEFRRVLKPAGRLVLLSLTEGVSPFSRALIAIWKAVYAVSPFATGGCRPVQLTPLVVCAGFHAVRREVVVQAGVPSEIVVATR